MVNAQEWLDHNYPKNGFCLINEERRWDENHKFYNNFGKKRNEITYLEIEESDLEGKLDVRDFFNLQYLSCWGNNLSDLILPINSQLKILSCGSNKLTNLNLKQCVNLKDLRCQDSLLISLILPASQQLTQLNCYQNQLTNLDCSQCPNLKELVCYKNQINSLILPLFNKLEEVAVNDNFLTSFDYSNLNNKTLKCLNLFNNNVEKTSISVFSPLINLVSLQIGNDYYWLNKGNRGNQFYGSLKALQSLTKLKELFFQNIDITADLEYLPGTLNHIECGDKIEDKLRIWGHNLTLWQAYHPELMIKAGKELIEIKNFNLETKKTIGFSSNYGCYETSNYYQKFFYDSFLIYDINSFIWETNKHSDNNTPQKIKSTKKFPTPTKLYQISTNQVIDLELMSVHANYAILSYVWGDLSDKDNLTTWDYTYLKKDGTVEHKQIGVNKKFNAIGTTHRSIKSLKKALATIEFLNKEHNANIDYLWMDQLCINQFDNIEQNLEVGKIREYYNNSIVTLISIDDDIEASNYFNKNDEEGLFKHVIIKTISSSWFKRSWTFQEGLLSKQTIFIFDDALIDGRRLALWLGGAEGSYNINPYTFITPLGWSYNNSLENEIFLNLGEALFAVSHREQTILLDKIYSILGLLPYGDKVKVEYKPWGQQYTKVELEAKLTELVEQAYLYNPKEIITYLGERSLNNWLIPLIDSNGSLAIKNSLNEEEEGDRYYLSQIQQVTKKGLFLKGHFTNLDNQIKVVEIDTYDWKNDVNWVMTLQFIINLQKQTLEIKESRDNYYSEEKDPEEIFIDMINKEVIIKSGQPELYQFFIDEEHLVDRIEEINCQVEISF